MERAGARTEWCEDKSSAEADPMRTLSRNEADSETVRSRRLTAAKEEALVSSLAVATGRQALFQSAFETAPRRVDGGPSGDSGAAGRTRFAAADVRVTEGAVVCCKRTLNMSVVVGGFFAGPHQHCQGNRRKQWSSDGCLLHFLVITLLPRIETAINRPMESRSPRPWFRTRGLPAWSSTLPPHPWRSPPLTLPAASGSCHRRVEGNATCCAVSADGSLRGRASGLASAGGRHTADIGFHFPVYCCLPNFGRCGRS